MRDLISKGLLTAAAASSVLSMSGGYATAVEADGAAVGSPGVLSGNTVQVPVEIPVNICGNTVDPVGVLNPAFGNVCANTSSTPKHSSHASHPAPQAHPAPPAHSTRPAPQADGPGTSPGRTIGHHPDAPEPHAPKSHAPRADGGYGSDEGRGSHAAPATQGAGATAALVNSPGVLSGNGLQAPLDIPLNLCGNSVDVVGVLNPAFGNFCANGTPETTHETPRTPENPGVPEVSTPPGDRNVVPPVRSVDSHSPAGPSRVTPVSEAPPHVSQLELASTGSDPHLLTTAAMSAGLLLGGGILYRRSTSYRRNTAAARV